MKKILAVLILILGGIGFIYFSPMFEKTPPKIELNSNGFTNLREPVKLNINDDSGIKYYSVVMIADNNPKELVSKTGQFGKNLSLDIKLPKNSAKQIKLIVTAVDTSKWHFFAGNEIKKEITLQVDTVSPDAQIINNSYAIGKGGSAAVIVKVDDEHLKDFYIMVNNKYKFKLTPFYKKNYYAALIAWPVEEKTFDANLIATDFAGNKAITHIPFYWKKYRYPVKKIHISDSYIKNKAIPILQKMNLDIPNNPVEIFKKENEVVRKMNNEEISELTSNISESKIDSFSLARFNPLPHSAKEAGYGEKRHYFYKKQDISFAIHKGIDLARVKRAKILASNYGKVTAAKWIGIYGNTLIVYHKLGLYTLYAHTSEYKVKTGDMVRRGEVIARTGSTGGVLGDHLHFGVYVQGIAVNPLEWMDSHWIKVNVMNVINSSKRLIGK